MHDTIEDTSVTYEQLIENFGKDVAEGVMALTKDESLNKDQQMINSLTRISRLSKEIGMVKLSDRIVNLSPPPLAWTAEKIIDYRAEAILIHRTLSCVSSYLADRLWEKIRVYGRSQTRREANAIMIRRGE